MNARKTWVLVVPKALARHAKTAADVVAMLVIGEGECVEYRVGGSLTLTRPSGRRVATAWLRRELEQM